jgi:Uma2 family endonuclease
LSRAEFERRYCAMPNVKKAELLEGVVYMPSPASEGHGSSDFRLTTVFGIYEFATPGVAGSANGTVRLDLDNEPQPDAFLRILETHGGQCRIDSDDFISGAPELVGEVSVTSASYDLHVKLHVYRRHGVREYIVWRVADRELDWFVLRGGEYERLAPAAKGVLKSEVFPGLWIDAPSLLNGDRSKVLAVLHKGLASRQHAAFVKQLAQQAASKKR